MHVFRTSLETRPFTSRVLVTRIACIKSSTCAEGGVNSSSYSPHKREEEKEKKKSSHHIVPSPACECLTFVRRGDETPCVMFTGTTQVEAEERRLLASDRNNVQVLEYLRPRLRRVWNGRDRRSSDSVEA